MNENSRRQSFGGRETRPSFTGGDHRRRRLSRDCVSEPLVSADDFRNQIRSLDSDESSLKSIPSPSTELKKESFRTQATIHGSTATLDAGGPIPCNQQSRNRLLDSTDDRQMETSSSGNGGDDAHTSNASTFHRTRKAVGDIVNDNRVQIGIIILIVINAIMMGIGTFDFVENDDDVQDAFEKMDLAFLILFTVELAMQLFYHGIYLFTDGWLVFDFVIIVLSWSLGQIQVIRGFRIFRAFRLVSRMEVLRNLVSALFAVAPSMMAIIALLVLILYVYAVICTDLFRDVFEGGETDYFGTLDKSLFTLFTMMTLEWAEVVREVRNKYWWANAVFGPFLVMTSFILYSLIIAVVCDAVNETEHADDKETELSEKDTMRQQIESLEKQIESMAEQQQLLFDTLNSLLGDDDDDCVVSLGMTGEAIDLSNQTAGIRPDLDATEATDLILSEHSEVDSIHIQRKD